MNSELFPRVPVEKVAVGAVAFSGVQHEPASTIMLTRPQTLRGFERSRRIQRGGPAAAGARLRGSGVAERAAPAAKPRDAARGEGGRQPTEDVSHLRSRIVLDISNHTMSRRRCCTRLTSFLPQAYTWVGHVLVAINPSQEWEAVSLRAIVVNLPFGAVKKHIFRESL